MIFLNSERVIFAFLSSSCRFSLVICLMEDFISVVKYSPRFLAVGDSNDDQSCKSQILYTFEESYSS